jgi:hypothetical protein
MRKLIQPARPIVRILFVAAGLGLMASLALADDPQTPSKKSRAETELFLQAYSLMEDGKFEEGLGVLRGGVGKTAKGRVLISALIDGWREQYFIEDKDVQPPAEWAVDWLKCAAVIDPVGTVGPGDMGGSPAAMVALEFSRKRFKVRDAKGAGHWVTGIGNYPELQKCWTEVGDGDSTVEDCLNLEAALREEKGLSTPGLRCPPPEPSAESIAALPRVFEKKE